MLTDLKVKVGPEFYRYHEGAIDFIPELLKEHKSKNILIVHGTVSWEKTKPKMKFLETIEQNVLYHKYTGECSYYGADLIAQIVEENDIDFIIGVGGGKLVDLVGYAAHICNVKYGVVPTLVSNCAPWTPLSVMYKESGESEGKTEHYMRQAVFLITDPYLVIDSPVRYFIAGLADTIAKWYESDSILAQKHLQNEPFLKLAGYTAKLCNESIVKHSAKAMKDMENKVVSEEFVHLSEIVIAVAGLCGGLGDKYARNAAAHAMHDAIAKYIPESHSYLHGEIVAYGVLYQLALEGRWATIDSLMPFYSDLKLPVSLNRMRLYPADEKVIDDIVGFIDSKEKVHLIPISITPEILKKTIFELEKYIEKR